MGLFDRFRRNKDESQLPSELETYYQDERTGRRSAALLLGVATFIVTLLIGSALFFGGRAVYRAITDDDNKDDTAQVQQEGSDQPQQGTSQQPGEDRSPNVDVETNTPRRDSGSRSAPSTGDAIPATGDSPSAQPSALPSTGD